MYINSFVVILMGFPCGSVAVQESWVQFLGWKDPLEKEMATHSNILAGKSHGQRSWRATYSPRGSKCQT